MPEFLRKYRLSNCMPHLEEHGVKTFDALKKLPPNDLKAIGFTPMVRAKLQKALVGQQEEAKEGEEEEKFVTVEEEEEAQNTSSGGKGGSSKSKKKKNKAKGGDKGAEAERSSVPGENGVSLDPSFSQILTDIGLSNFIKVFEQNNITSLTSCRYVTREALIGNFGVPPEKAGLLLAHIMQSAPEVAHVRRLPELAMDLAGCVANMKVSEAVRQQVKTSLQTNNVLSVDDARSKRFALMNEVGLTADCATELGRLLDAGPMSWQVQQPTGPSALANGSIPVAAVPQRGSWGGQNLWAGPQLAR
uniref:Ephrin receptor 1 SAM domain-containing protein n=1 Tax=Hemiselmis andersenii TaxID=464988 RepID=A0A6U2FBR1_HEMAN